MRAFLELVDRLARSPREDIACRWLEHFIRSAPDPDRGLALGVLAGAIRVAPVRPQRLRAMALDRIDPVLFGICREAAGTVTAAAALAWPASDPGAPVPGLAGLLRLAGNGTWADGTLACLLDRLEQRERQRLLALLGASWRSPVPVCVVRAALARAAGRKPVEIDELWSAQEAPYADLLAWLDGRGPRPAPPAGALWRPMAPTRPADRAVLEGLDPASWCAEWKWDGVRVQVAVHGTERRIWSFRGEDLGRQRAAIAGGVAADAVLDGVLNAAGASPALRLFDILAEGDRDLRALPLAERRHRLQHLGSAGLLGDMEVPAPLDFADMTGLRTLHAGSRGPGRSGLVLKRLDRGYLPDGAGWYAWDADPLAIDAVLLHVTRSGPAAVTCAFGVRSGGDVVPVARVALAVTDPAWRALEGRARVIRRAGPVRVVSPDVVCTIEYARASAAPSRKAGLVLHDPRVRHVHETMPATGIGTLEDLE